MGAPGQPTLTCGTTPPASHLTWCPKPGLRGGVIGHPIAPATNQIIYPAHRGFLLVIAPELILTTTNRTRRKGGGLNWGGSGRPRCAERKAAGGGNGFSLWSLIPRCRRGCGAAAPVSWHPWPASWNRWAMGPGWLRVPGAVLRRVRKRGLRAAVPSVLGRAPLCLGRRGLARARFRDTATKRTPGTARAGCAT